MSEERLAFPRQELRRRTARGAILNAVFLGGAEALVLVQGLIVIALLGPSEIGLYGIVTTTAMTIVALKRVGIDEAFVQQDEERQEEEFQRAFSLELGLSAILSLTIAVAAPIVALVYDEPRLLPLTLAVAYLPLAFALQAPSWVFFRRMQFLPLRLLQALPTIVAFLVTVPLAAITESVWSLVIGPLAGHAITTVAALRVSPYELRLRFDRDARRRYLRFSWPIFATAVALLVVQQGQILAFDIEGGLRAAGFITVAFTLTRYADRADQIVATTIYPAIAAVRDRLGTLEELFEKSNRLTLIWTLPFCALLILFAPDLVDFVLGGAWEPAVALIQGLAGAAAVQQLGYNWFAFYRARGESRPQAVESAALVLGFFGLAIPGLFLWGFDGFVWGRIAASALVLAVRSVFIRRLLPGVSLVWLAARGLVPVAAGVGLALALRLALWGGDRTAAQALAELALFLAGTAAVTWLLERGLLRELSGYLGVPAAPASAA